MPSAPNSSASQQQQPPVEDVPQVNAVPEHLRAVIYVPRQPHCYHLKDSPTPNRSYQPNSRVPDCLNCRLRQYIIVDIPALTKDMNESRARIKDLSERIAEFRSMYHPALRKPLEKDLEARRLYLEEKGLWLRLEKRRQRLITEKTSLFPRVDQLAREQRQYLQRQAKLPRAQQDTLLRRLFDEQIETAMHKSKHKYPGSDRALPLPRFNINDFVPRFAAEGDDLLEYTEPTRGERLLLRWGWYPGWSEDHGTDGQEPLHYRVTRLWNDWTSFISRSSALDEYLYSATEAEGTEGQFNLGWQLGDSQLPDFTTPRAPLPSQSHLSDMEELNESFYQTGV